MSRQDMFHLCTQNLLRRKARTILTILGMLIGCCAIVMMIALGFGMKETQQAALSEIGDLTLITVTAPSTGKNSLPLDDTLVGQLQQLSGVTAVSPRLSLDVSSATVTTGDNRRYVAEWTNVVGVDAKAMQSIGYRFTAGRPIQKSGEAVLGQYFAYNFRDTTLPEGLDFVDRFGGEWDENGNQLSMPPPFFDPLDYPCTLELETETGRFSVNIQPVGRVKSDYSKGSETAEGLLISMEDLRSLLAKVSGTSHPNLSYDSILVKVSGINRVEGVENRIKAMGYTTESMEDVRKPLEKEAQQRQLMLGGVGAISLVVAALGIINTMIMSISERTREIGIMKALGCPVQDIRLMFLCESGAMGLIGGAAGCVVSVVVSTIANLISMGPNIKNVVPALLGWTDVPRVCVIPWWLLAFAVAFCVAIGLLAGSYPANKAVRISALEAIRSI